MLHATIGVSYRISITDKPGISTLLAALLVQISGAWICSSSSHTPTRDMQMTRWYFRFWGLYSHGPCIPDSVGLSEGHRWSTHEQCLSFMTQLICPPWPLHTHVSLKGPAVPFRKIQSVHDSVLGLIKTVGTHSKSSLRKEIWTR